MTDFRKMPKY